MDWRNISAARELLLLCCCEVRFRSHIGQKTFKRTSKAFWFSKHLKKVKFYILKNWKIIKTLCIYYCNKHVLSLTHMRSLNVWLTTSMHGLHTSTLHLNETPEPLNWIRVCPSHCNEHSCECSPVLYCVSRNICKYSTFKPLTHPSFRIYKRSTDSHLT